MDTNFVCKLCGSLSPLFFIFTQSGKTPLCQQDLSKHMTTQASVGHTVFPIEAWYFAETPGDLQLYQHRSVASAEYLQQLQQCLLDENSDYETANANLEVFRKDCKMIVARVFKEHKSVLKTMQVDLRQRLMQCKGQFELLKSQKNAKLDSLSRAIASKTSESKFTPYSQVVHDVRKEIWTMLQSVMKTQSKTAEELLINCVQPAQSEKMTTTATNSKEKVDKGNISDTTAIPTKSRPTLGKCKLCGVGFTVANYVRLQGHEDCVVCLSCIDNRNSHKLRCPMCKHHYSSEVKQQLKTFLPEMIQRVAEKHSERQEKRRKLGGMLCCTCLKATQELHYCREKTVCFDCWERSLARHCFHSALECQKCGVDPTMELANREKPSCNMCRRRVDLTEAAHACKSVYLCAKCALFVTADGHCSKCTTVK